METRKWTYANVVLVSGQSYTIGAYRFKPGRIVKVTDPRIAAIVRGNPAFATEDHWAEEKPALAAARAAFPSPPKPAPAPAANPLVPPEEPPVPPDDTPKFIPATGVPVGAFVVTTESMKAAGSGSGKKVLKKKTKVVDQ